MLFFYFVTTLLAILFLIFVYATSLIELMDTFNFKDGRVHFRNLRVKRLLSIYFDEEIIQISLMLSLKLFYIFLFTDYTLD